MCRVTFYGLFFELRVIFFFVDIYSLVVVPLDFPGSAVVDICRSPDFISSLFFFRFDIFSHTTCLSSLPPGYIPVCPASQCQRHPRAVPVSPDLKAEFKHRHFLDSWSGFLPWIDEKHFQLDVFSDTSGSGCGGILRLPDQPAHRCEGSIGPSVCFAKGSLFGL